MLRAFTAELMRSTSVFALVATADLEPRRRPRVKYYDEEGKLHAVDFETLEHRFGVSGETTV